MRSEATAGVGDGASAATTMQDLGEQLQQRFRLTAELDASGITVHARDGAVTLTGTIQSLRERDLVTRMAWSMPGVCRVENLLSIA